MKPRELLNVFYIVRVCERSKIFPALDASTLVTFISVILVDQIIWPFAHMSLRLWPGLGHGQALASRRPLTGRLPAGRLAGFFVYRAPHKARILGCGVGVVRQGKRTGASLAAHLHLLLLVGKAFNLFPCLSVHGPSHISKSVVQNYQIPSSLLLPLPPPPPPGAEAASAAEMQQRQLFHPLLHQSSLYELGHACHL